MGGSEEPGSVHALVAGQVPLDLESVHGETALDMALGMEDDGLEVAQLLTRAWDRHLCRVILCLDRYSQGRSPHGQQLPWTATQRVIAPQAARAGSGVRLAIAALDRTPPGLPGFRARGARGAACFRFVRIIRSLFLNILSLHGSIPPISLRPPRPNLRSRR